MDKKYYFLKLNPPRASFMQDMTAEERAIMQQHVMYWKPYVENGTVIVLGPVLDPKGGYGISVVGVDDEKQLHEILSNDPANSINSYEFYPMNAVSKYIK